MERGEADVIVATIVAVVAELDVDALVVGARGRDAVESLLLVNVSPVCGRQSTRNVPPIRGCEASSGSPSALRCSERGTQPSRSDIGSCRSTIAPTTAPWCRRDMRLVRVSSMDHAHDVGLAVANLA